MEILTTNTGKVYVEPQAIMAANQKMTIRYVATTAAGVSLGVMVFKKNPMLGAVVGGIGAFFVNRIMDPGNKESATKISEGPGGSAVYLVPRG